MHDPLQAFSFSFKKLPPSLTINIANKHPLRMCLVHADYFVGPLAIMCIIFVVRYQLLCASLALHTTGVCCVSAADSY